MSATPRLAVLRESSLNRGGRATPPRGCRYAMLGAIRRTGCSFVFRFVFYPPPPPPPASASQPPASARRRERRGRGGTGGRQAPDSDNYCRFAAGKSIQPTPAAFSVEPVLGRADDSISLFSPSSRPMPRSHASFSATLSFPDTPAGLTTLLAAAYRRRASSCPAIFRAGELDSTGLDRAVAVSTGE